MQQPEKLSYITLNKEDEKQMTKKEKWISYMSKRLCSMWDPKISVMGQLFMMRYHHPEGNKVRLWV